MLGGPFGQKSRIYLQKNEIHYLRVYEKYYALKKEEVNNTVETLQFENRRAFRKWLEINHSSSNGIWIVFTKGNKNFTTNDALEEAICFGWIDGLMKSIDETKYKKYFSRRVDKKKWSEMNKAIYKRLNDKGLVTEFGIEAYQDNDRKNDVVDKNNVHVANIKRLKDVLSMENDTLKLFENTTPSRQKQLAGFYCEAKTEETRRKRKEKIIEAIKNKYKGMLY